MNDKKVHAVMNLGLGHTTAEAPSVPTSIRSSKTTVVPEIVHKSPDVIPCPTVTVPFDSNGNCLYLSIPQAKYVYSQLKQLFD